MSLASTLSPANELQEELSRLKKEYHRNCMFAKYPPVKTLDFSFNDDGALTGKATFGKEHQSYDHRVHGGLIAAIVDAGMTQCLMGHSIIAYTVDLAVRYYEPVVLHRETQFEIKLTDCKRDRIFWLDCIITQDGITKAKATSRFFGQPEEFI
ncbi:PaaI family thioesterase [Gracilimonas mengyeensis]|uniref:Acyl-coenzyme A thioesterase THEM4 n=1 Tax=Gracilimonas mengyeensis TaxID=1302730 RepID=A0A521ATQ0_9BACT|nr:hotdog domain-containing protein [Gracilimonas mengyeensis]SMO38203.1 Acyl-coenzyme A thioesterase PaaI, contains HGG motif [Gracilimonas mengyeensis]